MDNRPIEAAHFEVLIIGGGPAGVSCALECQDSRVSHLLLERNERLGGQLADITSEVPNFALGRGSGSELQNRLEVACHDGAINFLTGQPVVSIDLERRQVVTAQAIYSADAIFIATGYRVKKLEIPGENDIGGDVLYRTGEEEACLAGQKIVIIGGGDSALLEALARVHTASSVTVVHRSHEYKARPDLIEAVKSDPRIKVIENCKIESINSSAVTSGLNGSFPSRLSSISIQSSIEGSSQTIKLDKLVVKVGYSPNTELFAGQIAMDSRGHILVNQDCSTSVAGVFAGGDIAAPGYDRIATAIGHGMIAAGSIRKFLSELTDVKPEAFLNELAKTARQACRHSSSRV
jgi:Thioredoxin reductase